MATKYQAYSDYQKSDIEWSDVLPSHWGRVSLRWITVMYAGGTPSKNIEEYWEDGTVPWLNSGAVNQGLVTEASTFITEEAFKNSSAKWIPKDALVMALAGQGKTKGMVAQLGIDTTCNQSMAAVVPNDILDSRYIFWWLTSNYQNIRNMSGGDHRDGLNLELLGNIECPIPTHIEKQKIANFLDHETVKIDTLIEKQQQLIALLKEKRQAVISHAVTKGLNVNAPMRDSGVEWLGEVPEHWIVMRFRHACSHIFLGLTSKVDYVEEGGVPLVRLSNIQGGKLDLSNARYISEKQHRSLTTKNRAQRDDVLLGKSGAVIGTTAIVDSDVEFSIYESLFALRSKVISPAYLTHLLRSQSCHNQFGWSAAVGMGIGHLNMADILDVYVAMPPEDEQKNIVLSLDTQIDKFEVLSEKANSAIVLMHERRTALISAAVTGKIDVRNWQAPETNHTSRKGISV